MIQDALLTIANGLAYNGTTTPVSLKVTKTGPGKPLYVNVIGNGLVAATGITIKTGATSGTATTTIATHTIALATLNKGFSVQLPHNVDKWVDVALTGSASAGTWSAFVSENQGQTNL